MAISKTAVLHPTSIIEAGAVIETNVKIGPFCCIGANVVIKERTTLHSHVIVKGITEIGKDNQIYQFSSIGEINQDLKYKNEQTKTIIGDRNIIRESSTIHRGTVQGGGVTKIGNDNVFMVNTHIAHDCQIGNRCILANNVTLAGHIVIDDFAIVGGLTAIHQFCTIGAYAMIGGCSGVAQDVPPYTIAQGNHATAFGLNTEGLKRHGFSKESIQILRLCYKFLYRSHLSFNEARDAIADLAKNNAEVNQFLTFFKQSSRGIVR